MQRRDNQYRYYYILYFFPALYVMRNITLGSSTQKLETLYQIPEGAIPVNNGAYTKGTMLFFFAINRAQIKKNS
jgi:hypothetical protein